MAQSDRSHRRISQPLPVTPSLLRRLFRWICRAPPAEVDPSHVAFGEWTGFADLAENARVWFWEVDAEGRYTRASASVAGIMGYEPEELIGKPLTLLTFPEERAALADRGAWIDPGTLRDDPHLEMHTRGG